ncbi:MAG: energy transducer TonB [Nitrospirota bacterium]|nr:energy transducer TonB [Nitrospirota bacterium]MDH5585112.1 energy transducer TonB [Nitrospirota bacterium]MDH5773929.1 energy transducer TonB [Nitrospirota bacterium]
MLWQKILRGLIIIGCFVAAFPHPSYSKPSDVSTHQSDHEEDAQVETLPMVHVHGLRLNKDQQRGPVPQKTPWPTIPIQLEGRELDDWLKARFLVGTDGEATVVILEPAANRDLTHSALSALRQWTFLPKMDGDQPVEGEVSLRIHFRTQ